MAGSREVGADRGMGGEVPERVCCFYYFLEQGLDVRVAGFGGFGGGFWVWGGLRLFRHLGELCGGLFGHLERMFGEILEICGFET